MAIEPEQPAQLPLESGILSKFYLYRSAISSGCVFECVDAYCTRHKRVRELMSPNAGAICDSSVGVCLSVSMRIAHATNAYKS